MNLKSSQNDLPRLEVERMRQARTAIPGLGLGLALVAALPAFAAEPARIEIGEVAEGPVYYNRPGASLAAHDDELADCFARTALSGFTPKGALEKPDYDSGILTPIIFDAIWSGPIAGIHAVRVENCMLVRGWRAVRAPADEAATAPKASPEILTRFLTRAVGAKQPAGDVVRTFGNEVLHPDSYNVASRPRKADSNLSFKHRTALGAPPATPVARPPVALAKIKRNIKPAALASAPRDTAYILARTDGLSMRHGIGVVFSREADPATSDPNDWAAALIGTLFAKAEGNWFLMPVNPGRWRIEQMGPLNLCFGAPSFEVRPGEIVYAGSFHLSGATVEPDLDMAAAQAFLGEAGRSARPARYRNGSRAPCDSFNTATALELPGAPFDPNYRWGGARDARLIAESRPAPVMARPEPTPAPPVQAAARPVAQAANTPARPKPRPFGNAPRWVQDPVWERLPTDEEMWANFPPRAIAAHESGAALLECVVSPDGALEDCTAKPYGGRPELGFVEAALSVSKLMRMAPLTRYMMRTAGAFVAVPVQFDAGSEPAQPATARPAPQQFASPPPPRPVQGPPRTASADGLLGGAPVRPPAPAPASANIIEGRAVLTRAGETHTCAGREVRIFPANAASDAFADAVQSGGGLLGRTEWSPQPFDAGARITVCDASGGFYFGSVPDGRYYIAAAVSWEIPSPRGNYVEQRGGTIVTSVSVAGGGVTSIVVTP